MDVNNISICESVEKIIETVKVSISIKEAKMQEDSRNLPSFSDGTITHSIDTIWKFFFEDEEYVEGIHSMNRLRTAITGRCPDQDSLSPLATQLGISDVDICATLLNYLNRVALTYVEELRLYTIMKWGLDFSATEWMALSNIINKRELIYNDHFPKAGNIYDLLYAPEGGLLQIDFYIQGLNDPRIYDFMIIGDKIRLRNEPNLLDVLTREIDPYRDEIWELETQIQAETKKIKQSQYSRIPYRPEPYRSLLPPFITYDSELDYLIARKSELERYRKPISISNLRTRRLTEPEESLLVEFYNMVDVDLLRQSVIENVEMNIAESQISRSSAIEFLDDSEQSAFQEYYTFIGVDMPPRPDPTTENIQIKPLSRDEVMFTNYELDIIIYLHKLVIARLIRVIDMVPAIPLNNIVREDVSLDLRQIQDAVIEPSLVSFDQTPVRIQASITKPLDLNTISSIGILEEERLKRASEDFSHPTTDESKFKRLVGSVNAGDYMTLPEILTNLYNPIFYGMNVDRDEIPQLIDRFIPSNVLSDKSALVRYIREAQDVYQREFDLVSLANKRLAILKLINVDPLIGYFDRGSMTEQEHRNMLAWVNAQSTYTKNLPIETKMALNMWQSSSQLFAAYISGKFQKLDQDKEIVFADEAFAMEVKDITPNQLHRFIKLINNAIIDAPPLPHDVWVYKGLWGDNPYSNANIGDTLNYFNFMATSTDRFTSEQYIFPGGIDSDTVVEIYKHTGHVCCLVKLLVPRYTRGLYLFPSFADISEYILSIDIPITITNVYAENLMHPPQPLIDAFGEQIKVRVVEARVGKENLKRSDIQTDNDSILWSGAVRELEEETGIKVGDVSKIMGVYDFKPASYGKLLIIEVPDNSQVPYIREYYDPNEYHRHEDLVKAWDVAASGIMLLDRDSKEILLLRRTTEAKKRMSIPGGGVGKGGLYTSHKIDFVYRTHVYQINQEDRAQLEAEGFPKLNVGEEESGYIREHDAYAWVSLSKILLAIDSLLPRDIDDSQAIDMLYPYPIEQSFMDVVVRSDAGDIQLDDLLLAGDDQEMLSMSANPDLRPILHPGLAFMIWKNRPFFDQFLNQ